MASVDTIEGIGPSLSEKLAKAGVTTTEQLLEAGASAKGRKALEEAADISHAKILKFVNHADLMRIKGIGGEYSELLECAGVDTVPALAQRNAANLTAAMAEVNASKKLVRALPTDKQVADWVEQAKTLPRAVEY